MKTLTQLYEAIVISKDYPKFDSSNKDIEKYLLNIANELKKSEGFNKYRGVYDFKSRYNYGQGIIDHTVILEWSAPLSECFKSLGVSKSEAILISDLGKNAEKLTTIKFKLQVHIREKISSDQTIDKFENYYSGTLDATIYNHNFSRIVSYMSGYYSGGSDDKYTYDRTQESFDKSDRIFDLINFVTSNINAYNKEYNPVLISSNSSILSNEASSVYSRISKNKTDNLYDFTDFIKKHGEAKLLNLLKKSSTFKAFLDKDHYKDGILSKTSIWSETYD
ncbi:gp152 [Sphingomonas phage PAU]|uniref:gp152 n=1 Tax=Sphingomonas phage PAU TaxID=1150991 RepID=UPI00025732E4|nr:gp152 [Sphingomonas phage PAU]AFF28150.1 gp152 [Sphingomonas phage PAU]